MELVFNVSVNYGELRWVYMQINKGSGLTVINFAQTQPKDVRFGIDPVPTTLLTHTYSKMPLLTEILKGDHP